MSSNRSLTTAVIVTYNSRGYINNALNAFRVAHQADCLECIVVDNASCDGTADFIAANHPWVTLFRSKQNIGFGRGCNLGFQQVQTPYVLIHNPDAVMECKALKALVDFMTNNEQAGIVAPATIIDGGASSQAAGLMTTPASLLRTAIGFHYPMPKQQQIVPGNPPFLTSWVCGAIMLIRSDLFRRLGGFDPRFFLYFEETDFCRRATQAGAEIWAVGQAVASHLGGVSAISTGQAMASSCIAEHFYCSRFYYLVKHFGWLQAIVTETIVHVLYHVHRIRYRLSGRTLPKERGRRPFLRFPKYPKES